MDGQILRQSSSYRQGLVLGLTMAEIMILLVFCLLIAMATFLRKEQTRSDLAIKQLQELQLAGEADRRLVDALKGNPRVADLLKDAIGSDNPVIINEFWRDLIEGRDVAAAAGAAGLTVADIRKSGKDLKVLVAKGITADKAVRDASIAAGADKAMAGKGPVTPETVTNVINKAYAEHGAGGHKWPPIITLNDTNGQFFRSGSAELNPDFRQALIEKTSPTILQLLKEFRRDVIEVVGHTDEQAVGSAPIQPRPQSHSGTEKRDCNWTYRAR